MTTEERENNNNNRKTREDITEIKTILEDMNHRLFGNGQPGVIQTLQTKIEDHEKAKNKLAGAIAVVTFVLGSAEILRISGVLK